MLKRSIKITFRLNAQECQLLKKQVKKSEFSLVTDKCAEACEAMVQDILSRIKQYEFCEGISISVSAGIADGRRRNPRKGNMYKTIISLINLASLASTKAKKEKDNLVLGYSGMIDEIAI